MADQDLRINIETLADLTGIKLTQQQLDALQNAAKQGNIEAIEALKKLSQAQKDAVEAQKEAVGVAKESGQELTQSFKAAAGYGLLIGGTIAAAIDKFANAQNKVTKELAQQGELLVKNVQEWNKLAQAANTVEELAAVGEKATSQIEALSQKFKEANDETLTLSESVQDLIVKFVSWTPFAPGPNQALLEERIKGLSQDLAEAQLNAALNVKRRLDEQRQTHEDIDAVIARETAHLAAQQALLRNLDPKTQLQSWIAVEQTVERITKRLEQLEAQRKKQVTAGEPTTLSGLLGKQQDQLGALLASPRLTPVEREAVFQQQVKTREEKFQKDIADREKQFQKDIAERDKRFTTPPAAAPPGETTAATNQQLIDAIEQVMNKYWGP